MIRYTNEFLTDGDITIERVANRLNNLGLIEPSVRHG